MAKMLEVSISYYSKIESGYRTPSYEFMLKLKVKFTDVNIDEMFFKELRIETNGKNKNH